MTNLNFTQEEAPSPDMNMFRTVCHGCELKVTIKVAQAHHFSQELSVFPRNTLISFVLPVYVFLTHKMQKADELHYESPITAS